MGNAMQRPLPLPTSPTPWGGRVYSLSMCGEGRGGAQSHTSMWPINKYPHGLRLFSLHVGRYIKLADATDETLEFDLGKCRIAFDFSRIWPK